MRFIPITLLLLTINITAGCSYVKKPETMLHYLIREPKIKSAKPPVIIMMHGYGSNEADLFSLAQYLPDKFLVVSARGPQTLGAESYAWYQADFSKDPPLINKEQADSSRKAILDFIDDLQKVHPFDETQIYLVGFSQGAIMAYSLGLTEPHKFKGIAAMSGRILNEMKPIVAPQEKLNGLNIFITHGTIDPVINIKNARESKAFLNTLNIQPIYKEYPEGYTISQQMLEDLVAWLNGK